MEEKKDPLDELFTDETPSRTRGSVLWEKAHELDKEYTKKRAKWLNQVKKSEQYRKLQERKQFLEQMLTAVKQDIKEINKRNLPSELVELKAEKKKLWDEAQEQKNKEWEEEEQKRKQKPA